MAKKGGGSKKQAVGKKPVRKNGPEVKGAPQKKAVASQAKSAAAKPKSPAPKAKSSAFKTKSRNQSKLKKLLKGGGCLLPAVSIVLFAILLSLSLL